MKNGCRFVFWLNMKKCLEANCSTGKVIKHPSVGITGFPDTDATAYFRFWTGFQNITKVIHVVFRSSAACHYVRAHKYYNSETTRH